MEAIVLVGGLGTRLGSLTKNIPKPMLPIRGVPFLERLLQFLKVKGFNRVILAIGYKKEVVESYFSGDDKSLPEIVFSVESEPLGTGGAIVNALTYAQTENIFVLNGDSYLECDFIKMQEKHKNELSDITVASYFIKPSCRYGVMQVNEEGAILDFEEKGIKSEGLINGGVYLLNITSIQKSFEKIGKNMFSFEEEILSNFKIGLNKFHVQMVGYFLDIGIPIDYEKAQKELFL